MRDELQQIVDSLSRELDRSVLVDDPSLRLVAHSPLHGDEDPVRVDAILQRRTRPEVAAAHFRQGIAEAEAPLRTPAVGSLGLDERLCVPLRRQGRLLGFLWVIDPEGSLDDGRVELAVSAAEAIAGHLYREELAARATGHREEALARRLVGDDETARERAAQRVRELGLVPESGSGAAVVFRLDVERGHAPPPRELERAAEALHRGLVDPGLVGALDRHVVALVFHPAAGKGIEDHWPDIDGLHARLAEALPRGLGDRLYTGAGALVGGPEQLRSSYRQAMYTAFARSRLGGPRAGRFGDLGALKLLLDFPVERFGPDALPPGLRAVLQSETLVQTLERYLDLGCDATHAAADLGVHRATVYYRLARIEERGGFDLQDGATRLELHMALKLARLADLHGPP